MKLQDDVLMLRALEPKDLDILYKWENDTTLWNVGSTIAPFSKKQLWEYIKNYDGDIFRAKQLRFMAVDLLTGDVVGTIDLFDYDPLNGRAFVGLLIDNAYNHHGYGYRALTILAEYCRSHLSMHQLIAIVSEDNTWSCALFSKLGYDVTGRLRSWLKKDNEYKDAYIYQCMLS